MEIIQYLQGSLTTIIILTFIGGLMVGSFLNVVIHRLPIMMENQWRESCEEFLRQNPAPNPELNQDQEKNISSYDQANNEEKRFNLLLPRSRCPHCGHTVRARENIPILSYLLLKGKCSSCSHSISVRYPIIEGSTAILSVIVVIQFGFSWQAGAALLLTWALICLSVIDFDHHLLPDSITLPFLWIGLTLSLFGVFTDTYSAIIGGLVGYLSLWSVYQLFKLLTGKEGMGYGDFKLLAMLGAWLGWQYILLIILLSSFVGAMIGISLIVLRGRDRNIPIPFGPYLAIAGWIALLWGETIISGYLSFFSHPA